MKFELLTSVFVKWSRSFLLWVILHLVNLFPPYVGHCNLHSYYFVIVFEVICCYEYTKVSKTLQLFQASSIPNFKFTQTKIWYAKNFRILHSRNCA